MKYSPRAIDKRQITNDKNEFTSFNSPINPFIAKYKKPPDVKAKHSFKYTSPIILPKAVPISAPIDVNN